MSSVPRTVDDCMLSRDIQIDKPLADNAPNKFHLENRVKGIPAKDTVVKLIRIRMSKALCYFLSWKWIIDYMPLLIYRYCL